MIQAEIAHFRGLGGSFEWKHYDHDEPADLRERLVSAGFELEDEERLLALDLVDAPAWVDAADDGRVRDHGLEGLDPLLEVVGAVRPERGRELRSRLRLELTTAPATTRLFVAYEGGVSVAAAWSSWEATSPLVGLFGGSTLPAYRRRGHYRALVAARARHARSRGARALIVDAGPLSAPVLTALGFVHLTVTTPCVWRPDGGAGAATSGCTDPEPRA
ncbi:MAG: GNAT family N-acetyltransferase [Trueperaceae bacterium]|nr:MAG: GNAT family N-acetyltransferase [Trueperaceae bacterium]